MLSRVEQDGIGTKEIKQEAYYGIQSLRAVENFPMTGRTIHPQLVGALATIKKVAAQTNHAAGVITSEQAKAIQTACEEIEGGQWADQFIVDALQGGAGTSANMNMNEVVANRALEILGETKGNYRVVHPNDVVNASQSTNDVYPTAGKLALLRTLPALEKALAELIRQLEKFAIRHEATLKMGRTQLQDAVPTTYGRTFQAYAHSLSRQQKRLDWAKQELLEVNLGGTAIGTSVNATPHYVQTIVPALAQETGMNFIQATDLVEATQNVDCFLTLSGVLKQLATNLSKISHDLRLLSSGPQTGLAELKLPARQAGSSIMPGKVNPVIPEVVSQVAFKVIGNDVAITLAVEHAQLELNPFEPLIFDQLFENIELLTQGMTTLRLNALNDDLQVQSAQTEEQVLNSAALAVYLVPVLGYQLASQVNREARESGRSLATVLHDKQMAALDVEEIVAEIAAKDPAKAPAAIAQMR